jgi:predicted  nucleic acid-binding Zn-ribbon protein
METQTNNAEPLKPPSAESLEERLKRTEEELHKKCAEIVVLQQALQNLEKRVVDLESRVPQEVLFITHAEHYSTVAMSHSNDLKSTAVPVS